MQESGYNGHVLYAGNSQRKQAIGIVSNNYERKAIVTFIPKKVKAYLIEIEDKRFFKHHGIDPRGIVRACFENLKAGKIVQGGSTITQQLARNLLKDNRCTISRKIREIVKAIQIERDYTKDEILNLYFNNIYFGKNLFGLRSASLYYFKKEPKNLSEVEQIELLTILRGPNYYLNKIDITKTRFNKINEIFFKQKLISKKRLNKNLESKINLESNKLEIIGEKSIPFIISSTHQESKSIYTTLNYNLQTSINEFVSSSKYQTSVICVSRKGILAVASSFGSEYPFIAKSNVGSTLKPLLYSYLRQEGISANQLFSSNSNKSNWKIREVIAAKKFITLPEALLLSNNNAFVNACIDNGLNKSLGFLASTFKKENDNFFIASILGATRSGISLYELAQAYYNFFFKNDITPINKECLNILNKNFYNKTHHNIENIFLKTGTTNNNKERFAVLGNPDLVFALLRSDNPVTDYSKEGNFGSSIYKLAKQYLMPKTNYKWN